MMTTPAPATLQPATLLVTADAIRTYAELTDDFNPLHLDSEFAASTPMGRVIAHGTLSLCLLWQCIHRSFSAKDIRGLQLELRFIRPVFIGDVLTAGGEMIDTIDAASSRRWQVWVRGPDALERIAGEIRLL